MQLKLPKEILSGVLVFGDKIRRKKVLEKRKKVLTSRE
jgi:hypothetical protein